MQQDTKSFALAAFLALSAGAVLAQVPSISAAPHTGEWLQTGNANDAYWVTDNRWGQGSIPNGSFSQGVGVSSTAGSNGEVAWRMNWNWPQGDTEVKGYPAALYGRKPGYASSSSLVDGLPVKLPDGSTLTQSPSGFTPGTIFPMQLPIASLKAKVAFNHNITATGQGQLTFDIWLQSNPKQDTGWANASITHEIMIPLTNWGNYGAHPNGRNPAWYDHDATIGGKLYHVYITKDSDGCSRYNFGSLNGAYGKTGWKMIAFVPDQLPVAAGEIDLAALINYLSTRKDACGSPWALGNEYLVSAELGVEPVVGQGDITVYDYKISTGSTTPTTTTPTAPSTGGSSTTPPTPTTGDSTGSTTTYSSYSKKTLYTSGDIVAYNGQLYIARGVNFKNIRPTDTRYWSVYTTSGSSTTASTCSGVTAWVQGKSYAAGEIVSYNGATYVAKYANPGYNPTISTYYWAPKSC